jgi:hypothetical protein
MKNQMDLLPGIFFRSQALETAICGPAHNLEVKDIPKAFETICSYHPIRNHIYNISAGNKVAYHPYSR